MSDHATVSALLPLYAAGTLDDPRGEQRRLVERHVATCAECRADLALWQASAAEIVAADRGLAPLPGLADRALARIHAAEAADRRPSAVQRAWYLLRAQVPLVRREIWPAAAAVMLVGYAAAAVAGRAEVIRFLAPLAATACLAVIYGPENDPGLELALATPTSPWQVLLARLALVFGYDLALALVASAALLPLLPGLALGHLILSWLGPMAFLSAVALLLSMWIGAGNAVAVAYLAWLARFVVEGMLGSGQVVPGLEQVLAGYRALWASPPLLLALAALLGVLALWRAGRQERALPYYA